MLFGLADDGESFSIDQNHILDLTEAVRQYSALKCADEAGVSRRLQRAMPQLRQQPQRVPLRVRSVGAGRPLAATAGPGLIRGNS